MIYLSSWVRHLKSEVLVRNIQANSSRHQLDFSREIPFELRWTLESTSCEGTRRSVHTNPLHSLASLVRQMRLRDDDDDFDDDDGGGGGGGRSDGDVMAANVS